MENNARNTTAKMEAVKIIWLDCLASNDFSEYHFMTASRGIISSKGDKVIRDKWKKAVQRANHYPASGMGMLVNILRGKHDR